MKNYQVYLIQNSRGKRYIGLSEDVTKRLNDHNTGLSKYTAKFGPWSLIWQSGQISLTDARKLENLLKRQKGGCGLDPLLEKHRGSSSRRAGSVDQTHFESNSALLREYIRKEYPMRALDESFNVSIKNKIYPSAKIYLATSACPA